jgi:hypothetical protein
VPSLNDDEKEQRLQRAAKLLKLIAADTKRRAQQDSESAKRIEEAAEDIRKALPGHEKE